MKDIVIIGAGNVATRLSLQFKQLGLNIVSVYSFSSESGEKLSKLLDAKFTNQFSQVPTQADFYLVAIKDDSIKNVHLELKCQGIVAHTSGSVPMEVLNGISASIGVFYPLQTFNKNRVVNLSDAPFLIEANSSSTLESLMNLAKKISYQVFEYNSFQRQKVHLTAIWVNNFTNYMLSIAEELSQTNQIDFMLFEPLAKETIKKVFELGAISSQTGPAKRGDINAINSQLELMKSQLPEKSFLFDIISKQILKDYNTVSNSNQGE